MRGLPPLMPFQFSPDEPCGTCTTYMISDQQAPETSIKKAAAQQPNSKRRRENTKQERKKHKRKGRGDHSGTHRDQFRQRVDDLGPAGGLNRSPCGPRPSRLCAAVSAKSPLTRGNPLERGDCAENTASAPLPKVIHPSFSTTPPPCRHQEPANRTISS